MKFYYNKGINKEVLKKIASGLYSQEELKALHKEIVEINKNRKIGFKRAIVIVSVIVIIMAVLTLFGSNDKEAGLFSVLLTIVLIIPIFLYIKMNMVDKEKKQFIKNVSKGYPRLIDKYDERSFY